MSGGYGENASTTGDGGDKEVVEASVASSVDVYPSLPQMTRYSRGRPPALRVMSIRLGCLGYGRAFHIWK